MMGQEKYYVWKVDEYSFGPLSMLLERLGAKSIDENDMYSASLCGYHGFLGFDNYGRRIFTLSPEQIPNCDVYLTLEPEHVRNTFSDTVELPCKIDGQEIEYSSDGISIGDIELSAKQLERILERIKGLKC